MFRDSSLAPGLRAEEVHVPARGGIEELGQMQGGIWVECLYNMWEPVAADKSSVKWVNGSTLQWL